jgi:predicted Rossmann fold nucleotide-binding protein DprA/Smf involved in DNA uptake
VSFAPNLLIKQGARLVTFAGDVIEERATRSRATQPAGGRVLNRQRAESLGAAQFRRSTAD